jgi:hypothetical protein
MADLACAACRYALTVTAEVPDKCPICGGGQWDSLENRPKRPYELNENDRRLLKSLRIATDKLSSR